MDIQIFDNQVRICFPHQEVDSKAVEKEVLDKLAREEKENDRLWASIEAKEKEIRHLKGYQSQTVDLAKQVAELERNKKELEAKLRESKKATGNSALLKFSEK